MTRLVELERAAWQSLVDGRWQNRFSQDTPVA